MAEPESAPLKQLGAKSRQSLGGSFVLVDSRALPARQAMRLDELSQHGKTFDVFAAEGAKLIVMPEIRVEVDEPGKARQIKQLLQDLSDTVSIVSATPGRLQLRVKSGGSREALKVANLLWETFRPAVSHPRFIRIVPNPSMVK